MEILLVVMLGAYFLGNVAVAFAELWSKTYGKSGRTADDLATLVVTSDGGLVIAGYTNSFSGLDYDFWLFRMVSGTVPTPKLDYESKPAVGLPSAWIIMVAAVTVAMAGAAVIFRRKKHRQQNPYSLK